MSRFCGGLGGGREGGLIILVGVLQSCTQPFSQNNEFMFGFLSSSPFDWHPCWVILLKGGSGCLPQKCMECPQAGRGGVFRQLPAVDSKLAVHVLH